MPDTDEKPEKPEKIQKLTKPAKPEKTDENATKKGISLDTSTVAHETDWDFVSAVEIEDDWQIIEGGEKKQSFGIEFSQFIGQSALDVPMKQTLHDLGWIKIL